MIWNVEIIDFDLRYESFRLKNEKAEKELLISISNNGIQEALEGIGSKGSLILLNGFKRYRCAKKLGIGNVPYIPISEDEAMGIIKLLRISNDRSLTILEQAKLIDELKNRYKMSTSEIANELSKSKSWVSVRIGVIKEMSLIVRKNIFAGKFPVYSYMYTIRQFMRINGVKKEEIDNFVTAVSGKKFSIREIEQLAYGYFKGPDFFRKQVNSGNIIWCLERINEAKLDKDDCSDFERSLLNDFDIIQKYMHRVMHKVNDKRLKSASFFSQGNILSAGILSKINIFTRTVRDFYDRSGNS